MMSSSFFLEAGRPWIEDGNRTAANVAAQRLSPFVQNHFVCLTEIGA
jgi:hypothetical protein